MNEFALIARWFDRPVRRARLGIGDDCALLAPAPGRTLAVSTDMLVEGRHFVGDVDPEALGWKSLAVNLSDLAAMAAMPTAFTLAIALPHVDEAWLDAFARGLFACAGRFDCELVGGDTTRGPLTISITILGEVDESDALRRDAARVGDDVWVSGRLGDAALALDRSTSPMHALDPHLRRALDRPMPRVALGFALRGVAHAAIDVSDGLLQDLRHVLDASKVGARVMPDAVPISSTLASEPLDRRSRCALAGGDDYELCFTAPADRRGEVLAAGAKAAVDVTRIGTIVEEPGLRCVTAGGADFAFPAGIDLSGFDHFA